MKTFAKFGVTAVLTLVLVLSAGADDKKVIEKRDTKDPRPTRNF